MSFRQRRASRRANSCRDTDSHRAAPATMPTAGVSDVTEQRLWFRVLLTAAPAGQTRDMTVVLVRSFTSFTLKGREGDVLMSSHSPSTVRLSGGCDVYRMSSHLSAALRHLGTGEAAPSANRQTLLPLLLRLLPSSSWGFTVVGVFSLAPLPPSGFKLSSLLFF